jgi:hypothetical protein
VIIVVEGKMVEKGDEWEAGNYFGTNMSPLHQLEMGEV